MVHYVAAQSYLSDVQMDKIDKESMPRLRAACGYNRNTAADVMAAPVELGGAGFIPMKVAAKIGYVQHFLKNWRTPREELGALIRIVYSWAVECAGVTFPLLELPDVDIPHLRGHVITKLRRTLAEIQGKIHLDETFIRPALRTRDVAIMDIALRMALTKIQLNRINAVREFLGILYISELTMDGRTLLFPRSIQELNDIYRVTRRQPLQKEPNQRSWELFHRVLREVTDSNGRLLQSLESWTDAHSSNGCWKTYRQGDKVYEHMTDTWDVYEIVANDVRYRDTIDFDEFQYKEARPVVIKCLSNGKRVVTGSAPKLSPSSDDMPLLLDDFIAKQEKWKRELLCEWTLDDEVADVWELIANHDEAKSLLIVSDGSVKHHNMAYGWTISNPKTKKVLATGSGCGFGRGSSLRAEAYGMLSALVFLEAVCGFTARSTPLSVQCSADNEELINRCNSHKEYKDPYPNATMKGEFDVTEMIHLMATCGLFIIVFEWVASHQDRERSFDKLSDVEQKNVLADQLAGEYNDVNGAFRPLASILPSCPATLSLRGVSVTSDYKKHLIHAYTEPAYCAYLMKRFKWSEYTLTSIAWKCFRLATMRISRTAVLTKLCNDLFPTSMRLQRQGYYGTSRCITCKYKETFDHIIRCKSAAREEWRVKVNCEL